MDLQKFAPELVESRSYRQFLAAAMTHLGFGGRRTNYAAFARKAGFSSRSFPRDVIVGKRALTVKSLPKFIRGMQLRGDLKNYFTLLAALEEPDLNEDRLTKIELETQVRKLRARVRAKAAGEKTPASSFAKLKYWQEVFASLGSEEAGASLDEIIARTRLPQAKVQEVLEKMVEQNCVSFDEKELRYRPVQLHLNLQGLGTAEFFKLHLQDRLQKINHAVKTDLSSPNRLLFDSVWSIEEKRLPEFKQRLRQLVIDFIDETEKSDGDRIAHVFVSLGTN